MTTVTIKKVNIVPYNPEWTGQFEVEAKLLRQVLGDNCLEVHHIGSTAVPGLSAKPTIDMAAIVGDLHAAIESLKEAGYQYRGEFNIPMRFCFNQKARADVNLHITEPNHGFLELNLCFRDYLRNHKEARIEYSRLKEQLVKDPNNHKKVGSRLVGYTLKKDSFIKDVLQKSGFDGLCVNFCMHNNECQAYERILKHYPDVDAESHYHFVLYKGVPIVAAAEIVLQNGKAVITQLQAENNNFQYGEHLKCVLVKWIKFHGLI